jgi:hypothetical protein
MCLGELAVGLDRRRWNIEGSTPEHELLLAVGFESGLLVLPLKGTVVTLVEPPVADHRDPVTIARIEGELGRADRATQEGCVDHVRQYPSSCQQFSTAAGFGLTLLRQVYVDPSSEQIL